METVEQLLIESEAVAERFWFIRQWQVTDRTDSTVTAHFEIGAGLFVQAFLSQRSGRLSLALIGPSGRLFGRDRERGIGTVIRSVRRTCMKPHPKVCPHAPLWSS